jgi:nicotinate-nucleotide adenylyltransferase
MAHLKVACLGGSFNPIHNGHLALAKYLLHEKGFDEVWLILAKQAPLKDITSVSFEDRLAMIALASESVNHLKVCTIEKDMPSPSYTIDTVVKLQKEYTHTFSWVIGADQAKQFHQWKEADKLASLIPFYVINREDFPLTNLSFTMLPALSATSSSLIRQGLSKDTHPKVLAYMIMHHLYDVSILETHLRPKRIEHTISVKVTALSLIESLEIDQDAMEVAAMYHDIAKEWDTNEAAHWVSYDENDGDSVLDFEVHAYAAAAYLKHYYAIDNADILDAIRHHTRGTSKHLMAKVLFVADKIEPTRNYNTSQSFALAKEDIHRAFKQIKTENEAYNTNHGGKQ